MCIICVLRALHGDSPLKPGDIMLCNTTPERAADGPQFECPVSGQYYIIREVIIMSDGLFLRFEEIKNPENISQERSGRCVEMAFPAVYFSKVSQITNAQI